MQTALAVQHQQVLTVGIERLGLRRHRVTAAVHGAVPPVHLGGGARLRIDGVQVAVRVGHTDQHLHVRMTQHRGDSLRHRHLGVVEVVAVQLRHQHAVLAAEHAIGPVGGGAVQPRAGGVQLALAMEVIAVQFEHRDAVGGTAAGAGVAGQHQAVQGLGHAMVGGVQGLGRQHATVGQALVAEQLEAAHLTGAVVAVEVERGVLTVAAVVGGRHAVQGEAEHGRLVFVDMVAVRVDAAVQELHLVVVALHDHRIAAFGAGVDAGGRVHQGEVAHRFAAFQIMHIDPGVGAVGVGEHQPAGGFAVLMVMVVVVAGQLGAAGVVVAGGKQHRCRQQGGAGGGKIAFHRGLRIRFSVDRVKRSCARRRSGCDRVPGRCAPGRTRGSTLPRRADCWPAGRRCIGACR